MFDRVNNCTHKSEFPDNRNYLFNRHFFSSVLKSSCIKYVYQYGTRNISALIDSGLRRGRHWDRNLE